MNETEDIKLVRGVGVLGNVQKGYSKTREYNIWYAMLSRGMPGHCQDKNPSYAGYTVSEEFLNLEHFSTWCRGQKGFYMRGYHLDKDLLGLGVKMYSRETCSFIPAKANCLLPDTIVLKDGVALLPGVYYHVETKSYRSQIALPNNSFLTQEVAHEEYMRRKREKLRAIAESEKESLDVAVYHALANY